MREKIEEKRWMITGLIIVGVILSVVSFFTNIPEGGADNYAHFNISRWAFRYPHLFLDHWGKPLFTLLTAPLAQIGMTAVRMFNIAGGLLTAWLIYRLAVHLEWPHAWFAVIPVIFTPIYFVMMSSGMTEVLFSLVLGAAIYLFFKGEYIASALIISFIFLVRTEGLALLLLFLAGFLIKKSYKAIPFLLAGFLLFSLIGWLFHFHDFWWLINERPYATGGPSVYGSGAWHHFIVKMPHYYGYPVALLLVGGTIALLIYWQRQRFRINTNAFLLILLVLGSFWGYFFIHSFLWWKGETSAGLYRVMAGTSPLIAMMALALIREIAHRTKSTRVLQITLIILSVGMAYASAAQYHRSISRDPSAEILNRVSEWLKKPENIRHKLVIHNPWFIYSTGIDGWDVNVVQNGFSNNDFPEEGIPDSTLFVWDAHFSANEGRLPFEKILDNPHFEIVTCFDPVVPFKVLGGHDYKVCIFRKISGINANNRSRIEKIRQDKLQHGIYYSESFHFERPLSNSDWNNRRFRDENDTLNYLYDLEGADFSPAFHIPERVLNREIENRLRISAKIKLREPALPGRLLFVFSVENAQQSFHYFTSDIMEKKPVINGWSEVEAIFPVPGKVEKETVLKAYIWNIDRNKLTIDHISVDIIRGES